MSDGSEFILSAYGVGVRVRSNNRQLLEQARAELLEAFAGKAEVFDNVGIKYGHTYSVVRDRRGELVLFINGKKITSGGPLDRFLRFFNSLVRITVAEHAQSRVFVHAGVVASKGGAILIPARSFQGKSTLVKELVGLGAVYYSDEYAIIDQKGLVHPFPRAISLRMGSEKMVLKEFAPSEIGVVARDGPIGIRGVLFTEYKKGANWNPVFLSTGQGVLEIIRHTIPFRRDPEFALKVLNTALNRAIILKSPRGDAGKFARIILDFFDNCNL